MVVWGRCEGEEKEECGVECGMWQGELELVDFGGCRYVIGGFGSLEFLYWVGFWEDGDRERERERGLLAVKISGGLMRMGGGRERGREGRDSGCDI